MLLKMMVTVSDNDATKYANQKINSKTRQQTSWVSLDTSS